MHIPAASCTVPAGSLSTEPAFPGVSPGPRPPASDAAVAGAAAAVAGAGDAETGGRQRAPVPMTAAASWGWPAGRRRPPEPEETREDTRVSETPNKGKQPISTAGVSKMCCYAI